ncbi:carbohydrate kinase family protein [Roseobacter sp. OBYS 0001]|uniref:carbohydrate kinase family protein n=1 Tax=Roseobacter sp. OBYS 0001 TaxID=882651 RepID=UPI001BBD435E|nr:sugar kinase [Roseobacter sp. OBYS 0001]GIT87772.1 kinase [Roseobacter sp. OBYS 0001]
MSGRFDVSVVGLYILDILGRPVESIPEGGNVEFIDEIRLTVAGTAGGTVVDLAKLGLNCQAVGAVGDDEKADFVMSHMARAGIDCRLMQQLEGVETSATILNVRANGERPALHCRGASDHFDVSPDQLSEVLNCRFLHLGGTGLLAKMDGEPSRRLLQAAQKAGCVTTWDLVGAGPDTWQFVEPLLPHIDYFIPSIEEAEILSGVSGVEENIAFFQSRGVKCCVLTMGGDGSMIALGNDRVHVPVYDIDVIDTTGCGDAYTAGFIAGLADDRSLLECGHLGTAAASLVASGLGSDAGIIDRAQTEAAMAAWRAA